MPKLTKPQREVLVYLSNHPGADVYDALVARNGHYGGLATVSQRGSAGRMYWRMCGLGLLEGSKNGPQLTVLARELLGAS